VLAIDRFDGKDNASGGNGSLLDAAGRRRLHHMGRSVTDGAVGVRQPVRMKVRLLKRGAEEKKDCTQDSQHEMYACFRCPAVACSSHHY
jgi:hypothetical protein